jgi:hypothetical protein
MYERLTIADRLVAGYCIWSGRFLVWAAGCNLHHRLVTVVAVLVVVLLFSAVGAVFAYYHSIGIRLLAVSLATLVLHLLKRHGAS